MFDIDFLAGAHDSAGQEILARGSSSDSEQSLPVGPLFDPEREPKEVARLIKARVRECRPEIEVSVTSERGRGLPRVRCVILSVPFDVYDTEGRLTGEAAALRSEITEIGREYMHDPTDSTTGFYDEGFWWTVDYCEFLRILWRVSQPQAEGAGEVPWKTEGF